MGEISFFGLGERSASVTAFDFVTSYHINRSEFLDCVKKGTQRDLESFYELCDKITLNKNFQDLNLQCFSCQKHGHVAKECKEVHVKLPSMKIRWFSKKHQRNERRLLLRYNKRKFNAILAFKEVSSSGSLIIEEYLNGIDQAGEQEHCDSFMYCQTDQNMEVSFEELNPLEMSQGFERSAQREETVVNIVELNESQLEEQPQPLPLSALSPRTPKPGLFSMMTRGGTTRNSRPKRETMAYPPETPNTKAKKVTIAESVFLQELTRRKRLDSRSSRKNTMETLGLKSFSSTNGTVVSNGPKVTVDRVKICDCYFPKYSPLALAQMSSAQVVKENDEVLEAEEKDESALGDASVSEDNQELENSLQYMVSLKNTNQILDDNVIERSPTNIKTGKILQNNLRTQSA